MTKVTSTKSISFPKLNWGITEGAIKELPEDKEAQERILSEDGISIVGSEKKVDEEFKNKSENKDNKK